MRAELAISLVACHLAIIVYVGALEAQTVDPDIARRTAEAGAVKAEADAKKAQLDYTNAQPTSGLTGKVDVKSNAGQIEATVLTTQALAPIAKAIVAGVDDALKGKKGDHQVVIVTGTDGIKLVHWDLFRYRTSFLSDAFTADLGDLEELDKQYEELKQPPRTSSIMVTAAPILILSAASKLLSYAMSDYEVGSVATTPDDQLLVAAIVNNKGNLTVLLPSLLPSRASSDSVLETVSDLDESAQSLRNGLGENKKKSNELKALAKKDTKQAKQLVDLAEHYDEMTSKITAHVAAYEALMSALASTEDKSLMPLTAVLQEHAIAAALDDGGYALIVHIHSAAGSYYTKKNLWTAFGSMPFYVSGGAVASYTLMDGETGHALAGGVAPFVCGYRRASKVASASLHVECSANP